MTLTEFFSTYNGQGLNFDGAYGNQCMDVAQYYNRDVVGAPRLTGNAVDVWTTYPKDFYDQIHNAPDNFPLPGDIVIWSNQIGGGFGHIAICQTADVNSFTSLDQNWPIEGFIDKDGNHIGTGKAHFQQHNYANVLGWLRPKHAQAQQPDELQACRTDRDTNWNLAADITSALGVTPTSDDKSGMKQKALAAIQTLKDKEVAAREEAQHENAEKVQYQNAIATLNHKIADLNQAMAQDAVNDADLAVKLRDAEQALKERNSDLSIVAEYLHTTPDIKSILAALSAATEPNDTVSDEYLKLAEELFNNYVRKQVIQAKPFIKQVIERIQAWLK